MPNFRERVSTHWAYIKHAFVMKALSIAALVLAATLPGPAIGVELSDTEIRDLLIRESIATYPGNCPCPYSVNRAGRRCGATSAYSKPGGYSPLCYPTDVTQDMIDRFRRRG